MCFTDTAQNFEAAKTFLEEKTYDAAIFDIMGVNGYELLSVAMKNNIPALMLTAHALNPLSLVKSIKSGARAYLPKDKMVEIDCLVCGKTIKIPSYVDPEDYDGQLFCRKCNLLLDIKLKSSKVKKYKVAEKQPKTIPSTIKVISAIPRPDYSK